MYGLVIRPQGRPCGFLGDPKKDCHCTPRQARNDLAKISGPLPEQAMHELALSARAHHKIRRVARTIADFDGDRDISVNHISEAIQYRNLDREMWV